MGQDVITANPHAAYADGYGEDARILTLLKPLLPDAPVIYDVGASNGVWTHGLLKVFPSARIVQFDPMEAVSDVYSNVLRGLAKLNPAANVTHHSFAIGDRDGRTEFHVMPDATASTTLLFECADQIASHHVEMRKIDTLVAEGLPRPDLIKMDIQGGELAALQGAIDTLPHVRALHLETWITKGYGPHTPLLQDLIRFVRPFGFNIFDVGTTFRDPTGVLYAIDVTFLNPRHAAL